MYYPHSTSQPDIGVNQAMSSENGYYFPSPTTTLPLIPSTTTSTTDMTSGQSQQLPSQSILSNPSLPPSVQIYDHHQQHSQPQQHLHQELVSHDTSLCTVLPSTIDEDASSHASSSLSANRSGNQDAYILQLQKQLDESKHLQTQYYYRIEQLMSLVEKQTLRISDLQEQLATGQGGGTNINNLVNNSTHQQQQQQNQQHQIQHHHHNHHLQQQ